MILPDHRKQSRRRFPELAVFVCSLLLLCAASAPAQGFKLVQGYLEPVIARANRPCTITVMIQNTNALAAYDLRVQLTLPASAVGLGASAGLTSNIPILAGGEIQSVTWDVQSSLATNTTATVRVIRGATTNLTATFPVWWQSPLTVTNAAGTLGASINVSGPATLTGIGSGTFAASITLGASLSAPYTITLANGAPMVNCPYCHTIYQMTEEPKW